ncbi:MAG: YCF48-related protein [Agriterribacter sp.]
MIKNPIINVVFFLLILISCTKQNDDPPPVQNVDSLGVGWKKVAIGEGRQTSDIWFSENTGFLAGGHEILKSDDFGDTWNAVVNTKFQVFNVSMGSPQNIMAIGYPQTIYYSNNAGASFDSITLQDKQLNEIFCINPTVAYAIGYDLWKTSDAGKNWQKIYSFPVYNERLYRTVHFINEFEGWAIAGRNLAEVGVYNTQDGGNSWQFLDSGKVKFGLNSLFFTGDMIGYTGNGSQVLKTIDGGSTWGIIKGGVSGFVDTHFFSPESGYVSGDKKIYKTIDGGLHFTTEVSLSATNNDARVIEIYFADPNKGWACGYKGYILKYQK